MKQTKLWMLAAIFVICGAMTLQACANDNSPAKSKDVTEIADKVWAFSQSHPDGFTLNVHTMTCPTEGIAVSYAATQDSHSRDQLESVVSHALQHDGYVGGWLDSDDGLYYFDSTRLFPEDSLAAAIQFGKENGQHSVFILSTSTDIPLTGKNAQMKADGSLRQLHEKYGLVYGY